MFVLLPALTLRCGEGASRSKNRKEQSQAVRDPPQETGGGDGGDWRRLKKGRRGRGGKGESGGRERVEEGDAYEEAEQIKKDQEDGKKNNEEKGAAENIHFERGRRLKLKIVGEQQNKRCKKEIKEN